MENNINKYNNSKIYKIEIEDKEEIYIGSTTYKYLSKRFANHKTSYRMWKRGLYHKLSVFEMFEKYGVENCRIVLLENVNVETKKDLEEIEGEYIKHNTCINKNIPGQNIKENSKEYQKEYQKEYRKNNKEKKIQYLKEYRKNNKEKIREYRREYNQKKLLL
jgi:hypothetical protein